MNLEEQILAVMLRIRLLETSTRTADHITMLGIALVLTELAALREELRQDVAALVDELTGLRHHMSDHLATCHPDLLRNPYKPRRPHSN